MSNHNDSDNKTNINGKRPADDYYNNVSNKKPNKHVFFYDEDDDIYNNIFNDDYYINDITIKHIEFSEDEKEMVIIDKEITCLLDLIELGKLYDINKRYNIDLKILSKLVEPLTELNNMIGMDSVKQDMVDHILFRIQNLDSTNQDMMHTVIQGPPGVGKTEVAKIIGKIYLAMGILKNNKFVKATRSTLIAGYLGQTAKATQKVIDSAIGGILFIDEVYSLGNSEKRDSFAKECIDTLNENLTENKTDFICIIAGYKEEIDTCFFAFNSGLERRFPVRFTIEPYKPEELFLIFKKKVYDCEWSIDETIKVNFFIKNYKHFKFFGGDMEILFARCKRSHSRRIFAAINSEKKVLNFSDLSKGFESFKTHRQNKKKSNYN